LPNTLDHTLNQAAGRSEPSKNVSDIQAWLLENKLLTAAQADLAQRESGRLGLTFSEIIERLGLVTSEQLAEYRSAKGRLSKASDFLGEAGADGGNLRLRRLQLDDALLQRFTADLCLSLTVVPLAERDGVLWVASANPFDLPSLKRLEAVAGQPVEALPASETDIRLAINRNFTHTDSLHEAVGAFIRMDAAELNEQSQDDPPMIQLAEQLLMHAATREASDLHLHPEERFLRIRLRIDGILEEGILLPGAIQNALTARFKILAGLDTAEDRLPQDGRIHFAIGSEEIDIRVSSLPSSHGESIVMRLLDQSRLKLSLPSLGFSVDQQQRFSEILREPHGVFLITGPTGSGKTTTLYTLLSMIDAESRSVFTLEDPIEYRLPLVRQTQIKDEIGLSFARGLRSLLRQDPDVILVGETRDQVTAELMIRAALTGHLVFSTLHTNDAISAVPRLVDLGIPPFLLSSSLIALSAQRLARRLCSICSVEKQMSASAWNELVGKSEAAEAVKTYEAGGCPACGAKGYSGRISLAEIIQINPKLREMIEQGTSASIMKRELHEAGINDMRGDGLEKVRAGLTSVQEVARVVPWEKRAD